MRSCGGSSGGAGGGADGKPFGGAADAPPETATLSSLDNRVPFSDERGVLSALVGKVTLRGRQLRLASLAVDDEVEERLQIFGGNLSGCGFGRGNSPLRSFR